jgi:adenylate cyclase
MPKLTYTDPSGEARELRFNRRVTIGRHPSQDLQLLDRVVSKEHALIEERTGHFVLRDNGSRNGMTVNGEPVVGSRTLIHLDKLTIGASVVTFHADLAESKALRTQVAISQEREDGVIRTRHREDSNRLFVKADQFSDVEQLRGDYEKLRIANELNQALSLEFDLSQLLNKILEKAFEMFAADRGVIFLMNQETGEIEPAASRSKYEEISAGQAIRVSATILKEVVEEKAAVLSSDAAMDSRFSGSKSIIMQGIKSTMSVPLLYRDRLLGIIHLDSQMTRGAFAQKDLALLSGFANQAAYAIEHSSLVAKTQKDLLAREQLSRLLPIELVDQVMEGKVNIQRGGDLRDATVLFADIRGFTQLSESARPTDVVSMLNEYFEVMVEVVFKHGGTLDKFIGDALMAVWGAPIAIEDHVGKAVRAAIEMQEAVRLLNLERSARGDMALAIGIGVNTGEMVAGYMGSTRAMAFTVIGDTVNTASRLCSKAAPDEVLVSEPVAYEAETRFTLEELAPLELKGKANVVQVFRVTGFRDSDSTASFVRRSGVGSTAPQTKPRP